MMLESFILYVARDRIKRYDKDYLLNIDNIHSIMAEACKQIDVVLNQPIKEPKEYIESIHSFPNKMELLSILKNLYFNLGVKQYDTDLTLEAKKQIIKNSIACFNIFFQDLKQNYDYKEFQSKNSELKNGDNIIENLEVKIKNDKEVENISNSMKDIDVNFIINYNGQNIYPIITDLLIDTIATEFQWNLDKELNQVIIREWQNAKKSQRERETFKFLHYTKLELLEMIKFNNLRPYLLAEYARTLQVDKKKLRKFMQHVLYYDVQKHKKTPKLDLDIIDKISSRPFLLEKTKIVLGGI